MKLILFIVLVLLTSAVYSQDYIIKKDGEKIEAKVLEVTTTHVKYRKFSQPEGPNRSIEISLLKEIIYEDGQFDTFETPKTTPTQLNLEKSKDPLNETSTPEEELKYNLRRDPIMKSGLTIEGIFGFASTKQMVYNEYIIGYDQWGNPIYDYSYNFEPVRYLSLNVKLANKWYFNQSDTWRTGLQVNWFRFGVLIDPSDVVPSLFIGPKIIAPLNIGWTNVIRINEEWGLEANITGGGMLNIDLDFGKIYDGYSLNPEIKVRHQKLSFGLDYMYFNDSRSWHSFGVTVGAKL